MYVYNRVPRGSPTYSHAFREITINLSFVLSGLSYRVVRYKVCLELNYNSNYFLVKIILNLSILIRLEYK